MSFIDDSKGQKERLSIALNYTDNINGLVIMMQELYKKIENRSIKTQLTKNIKYLKMQLDDEDSEASSHLSQNE